MRIHTGPAQSVISGFEKTMLSGSEHVGARGKEDVVSVLAINIHQAPVGSLVCRSIIFTASTGASKQGVPSGGEIHVFTRVQLLAHKVPVCTIVFRLVDAVD